MKVFLGNPPWRKPGFYGVRAGSRWPHFEPECSRYMPFPFQLAYAAAILERDGFEVRLVDGAAERISDEAYLDRLAAFNPALVIHEISTISFEQDMKIIGAVRRRLGPGAAVAVCGLHAHAHSPDFLAAQPAVDYSMIGEYELTALELARRLAAGRPADGVEGLVYRDGGGAPRVDRRRPLIADLDSLPWPARHLLPMNRYQTIHTGRKRFATLITSRGCPGKCMFCFRPFGRNLRYRSIENVMAEVRELVERFGVEEISILDDAFTLDRARVAEFCDRVLASGLRFAWRLGNGTRVDLIDEELLGLMKRAGCYEVAFGIESGDDEVLRKIGKEITTAQVERAFAAAKRAGMETIGFFMIGHPFDTVATMKKTIDFAIRLDPTYAQFTMSTPLPGTALWTWVKRHGRSLIGDDVTKLDFLGSTPHYETDGFTADDARTMYRKAYRRFYVRPRYIWRSIRRIRSINDIVVILKGLLYLRRI